MSREENPSKIEIDLTDIPIKLVSEALRSIMKEMGYTETLDFIPLSRGSDVLKFDMGDKTIFLICSKEGEPGGKLAIQGRKEDVEEIAAKLTGGIMKKISKTILKGIMDEEEARRLSEKLERSTTEHIKRTR